MCLHQSTSLKVGKGKEAKLLFKSPESQVRVWLFMRAVCAESTNSRLHATYADIGVSAQTLLDVTLSRQQAAKTEAGRKLLAEVALASEEADALAADPSRARSRSRSASPTKGGNNGGVGQEEDEDAYLAAEEDVMRSAVVYPRKMLSLELDDGISAQTVRAIEMDRIHDLGLGKTELGCKVIISGASSRAFNSHA